MKFILRRYLYQFRKYSTCITNSNLYKLLSNCFSFVIGIGKQQNVNRQLAAQSQTFRSITYCNTTSPRACRAAVTNWNQRHNSINSDNLKVPAN